MNSTRRVSLMGLLLLAVTIAPEAQVGSNYQTPPPDGVVVFTQDGGGTPLKGGWSNIPPRSQTPSGRWFIGPMGLRNNNVDVASLRVPSLIPHDRVVISFSLLVNGSVEGSGTSIPELFTVKADGQEVFAHTFSNVAGQTYNAFGQSGLFAPRTGAHEVNTLGYGADAVYRITLTVPHDRPTLDLSWWMALNETISSESWGLDDVEVRVVPRGLLASSSGRNNFWQLGDGSTRITEAICRPWDCPT